MRSRHKNKIGGLLITSVLCVSLLMAPFSHTGHIQNAEAQLGPISFSGGINVTDIGQTLVNTLSQLSSAALEQKELVIDPLFYQIAQQALQQMTNDILTFVNSGFDGEPAFITDLSEYLQEAEDDVAGEFIYGDELSSLCEPFQLDVRLELSEQHRKESGYVEYKDQVTCTLNGYSNNMEAFLSGDFNAGGWSAWFETSLNPQNTSLGAKLATGMKLDEKKETAKDLKLEEYQKNDGFKDLVACDASGDNCKVTTPGNMIKDQASFALTLPGLSLLNADEMNESIGALFGNLANQALTGVNGLLGLSANASFGVSGNLSYLDAIQEEGVNNSQTGLGNGNKIQQALITETKVLEMQLAIVTQVDDVVTLFEEKREPYKTDACWNLVLPTKLSTTLSDLLVQVPKTVETVITLQELSDEYDNTSGTSGQLKLLQQLTSMQSNGSLGGQASVVKYDYFLNSELKKLIDDFIKEIAAEEKSCKA